MEILPTTDQDRDVFVTTLLTAFGLQPDTPGEDGGGVWWSAFEMDCGLMALTEDGRPVGTTGAYSLELTLPGETLAPVAGITGVGVLPSHRRRGVLTAMMRHQLAELRARGESLCVLLAAEAGIYGRFGYGPAPTPDGSRWPATRATSRPGTRPSQPSHQRASLLGELRGGRPMTRGHSKIAVTPLRGTPSGRSTLFGRPGPKCASGSGGWPTVPRRVLAAR